MKDPYQTLGVSSSASLDDIKSAYKKLARKHHPDLNPGSKAAEEKFKEISHAFNLIGTAEAKAKFDRGETDEQKQHQYDEYMKNQGSRGGPFYQETQNSGGRYSSEYASGMDEDIFSAFFGRNKNRQRSGGFDFPGEDELYQMEIDFKESAIGAERILTLPNGKKLQVQIPGGITSGMKLKFRGQGGAGVGKGPPGDAYIQISVRPSEKFQREGQDILSEVPISLFEAINGGEVEVETVDGSVMLKVPSGVSSGTKLRIKGKGAGKVNERGNHLAVMKVMTPKAPSAEFRQAVAQLQKQFNYNPRTEA